MKKIAILFIFVTCLYAQNPKVYTALGDTIYDNASKIGSLTKFDEYKRYSKRIEEYIQEVNATKEMGFKIENKDNSADPKIYLAKLRALSTTDAFFTRDVTSYFKASMKDNNSELFLNLMNTGLIDTQKFKADILAYYELHKDTIEPNETIEGFLDEIELKKQEAILQEKKRQKRHIAKVPHETKIQRLRKNDKAQEEELQRRLEEERQRKKMEILEEQKRELAR